MDHIKHIRLLMQRQTQTLLEVEEAGGFGLRRHQHAGLILVCDINLWKRKKEKRMESSGSNYTDHKLKLFMNKAPGRVMSLSQQVYYKVALPQSLQYPSIGCHVT